MLSTARVFACNFKPSQSPPLRSKTQMEARTRSPQSTFSRSGSLSPPRESLREDNGGGTAIALQEWQGWGTESPLPERVAEIVHELKYLEKDFNAQMSFGGVGGKLQGDFKIQEDKKHRATYQALGDSEKKLQFFSARQIACRLLGSRGYLCQKCWLALEDCMCSKVIPCALWHGIRFWLYMHPKNNTGKLLWQVFGVKAATLCLFGIAEHEEIMWNTFALAGKSNVWCLYPNKNAPTKSVQDIFAQESLGGLECPSTTGEQHGGAQCGRAQPSWDRTCTAAAAIGLLSELQLIPEFGSYGLDKQAEAVEDALAVLLEALTARRLRMGRSISRKQRHNTDIC
ncbi:hypothetical protein CK203_015242 [Vitis vinifera]|uniref:tRNA-uridine aminocarboxypropyltransferase n=1 Tax=Vitis vinifera TaxID=29760 RepID=A0A438JK96_VITVI|nr:hypothetical protein CK203_015242 [Vitis vinifera]